MKIREKWLTVMVMHKTKFIYSVIPLFRVLLTPFLYNYSYYLCYAKHNQHAKHAKATGGISP